MKFGLLLAILMIFIASGKARAENVIVSPLNYGATCNGSGDDGVGINAALAYLRAQATSSVPLTGILQLPAGQCTLLTTINATGLTSGSVLIQGTGGSLLCQTTGKPCIDATNSNQLGFRDITITGSQTNMPNIGLQEARPSQSGTSADMYLDHVTMNGYFSLAGFYNLNSETQLVTKLNVQNSAQGGYGAIYDGYNYFNAQSTFNPITEPINTMESFGDNTCVSCRITTSGAGAIPLWIGGTIGLTFLNSYISQSNSGVGAVLYGYNANLHMDAHFEATGLTSVFLLQAQSLPIYGMFFREHDFLATTSLFALGTGANKVTMEDVDLNIGSVHNGSATWFDNPANYTVSGQISGAKATGWTLPGGGFSGTTCFQTTCVTH